MQPAEIAAAAKEVTVAMDEVANFVQHHERVDAEALVDTEVGEDANDAHERFLEKARAVVVDARRAGRR
jgi:hypothetical protein